MNPYHLVTSYRRLNEDVEGGVLFILKTNLRDKTALMEK